MMTDLGRDLLQRLLCFDPKKVVEQANLFAWCL